MTEFRSNPFSDPAVKPAWAQLTRLGGDRVAILFEELRKSISKIDGIIEGLHYAGEEEGWVAAYRADGTTLFTARIFPGALEVAMAFDRPALERLLQSRKLSAGIKEALRDAAGSDSIRLCLENQSMIRSFANLVVMKSRLAAVER